MEPTPKTVRVTLSGGKTADGRLMERRDDGTLFVASEAEYERALREHDEPRTLGFRPEDVLEA